MRSKNALRSLFLAGAISLLVVLALGGGPAAASDLHPLTVTAAAHGSCTWGVTKTAPTHLTLAIGEGFDIPYTVDVTQSCSGTVSGTVSGGGSPTSVSVTLSDGTVATVSGCTTDGLTFTCNYSATTSNLADGTANALANYSGGDTSTGSASYSFAGNITDESVDVIDSQLSSPLAVHLAHPATFHYTVHVSFSDCGTHTVSNTATVRDGTDLAHATAVVTIDVPCPGHGCTLTQGYWKTHSKYGPAPSDATWNLVLPSGPDTTFFLSGQSWIQVFGTAPGGNAYYILAVQFMAAKLNMLNGASSTSAVDAALAWATTFFNTYTPAQIGALKGNDPLRQTAISNASTLESYNTGAIGPGHCSE
jgi:hypothetical protein